MPWSCNELSTFSLFFFQFKEILKKKINGKVKEGKGKEKEGKGKEKRRGRVVS